MSAAIAASNRDSAIIVPERSGGFLPSPVRLSQALSAASASSHPQSRHTVTLGEPSTMMAAVTLPLLPGFVRQSLRVNSPGGVLISVLNSGESVAVFPKLARPQSRFSLPLHIRMYALAVSGSAGPSMYDAAYPCTIFPGGTSNGFAATTTMPPELCFSIRKAPPATDTLPFAPPRHSTSNAEMPSPNGAHHSFFTGAGIVRDGLLFSHPSAISARTALPADIAAATANRCLLAKFIVPCLSFVFCVYVHVQRTPRFGRMWDGFA